MRSLTTLTIGVAVFWVCSTVVGQQAGPDFSVADKYFAKYLKGDIDAIESSMSEDFYFEDSASKFEGKEAAVEGLKRVFENLTMGEFTEQSRFHSGTNAVYVGSLCFTYKGKMLGVPGASFEFDLAFVVSLTMDGDQVSKHIDYVDTDAFMSQYNKQLAEIRKSK